MIITLSEADFSSDNIGTIALPVELHTFTKKIFGLYTRFSEDSEQAIAVDKFVRTLDTQGILSHIDFMTMPWLAKDANELFVDVVSSDKIVDTNTSYFTISNGAVSSSSLSKSVSIPSGVPTVNFFGLIKNITPTQSALYNFFSGTNVFISSGAQFSSGTGTAIGKAANYNSGYGYKNNSGQFGSVLIEIGALTLLDEDEGTLMNGEPVVVSGAFDNTESLGTEVNKYSPVGSTDVAIRCISFAGDGTALSSTQRGALISAMETLRTELNDLEA